MKMYAIASDPAGLELAHECKTFHTWDVGYKLGVFYFERPEIPGEAESIRLWQKETIPLSVIYNAEEEYKDRALYMDVDLDAVSKCLKLWYGKVRSVGGFIPDDQDLVACGFRLQGTKDNVKYYANISKEDNILEFWIFNGVRRRSIRFSASCLSDLLTAARGATISEVGK